MRHPFLAFVVLSLLTATSAEAQQRVLTMDEAVARTLAHNPALRVTRSAEQEADARLQGARSGYLPRIDVVEGWQRANQPVFVFSTLLGQRRFTSGDFSLDRLNHPDALSNHRAAVMFEQTVFDGARTAASVATARQGIAISRLETDRTAADLRLATVAAYGRLVSATALRTAARTAVDAAAEDLRRAEARRDMGLETEANVLAFRVHATDARARQTRAEADETVARAELNALMGAPLDELVAVQQMADAAAPVDAAALEQEAVASRVELKQASLRRRMADSQRQAARASLLPQVVAQAAAEANGDSFGDRASAWTVGVIVRWNAFAGGADAARLREAAAAAARADAERERIETAIRLEVRTAAANLNSALAREAAGREMLEQARESRRIVRDRYEAGLASASDLLRSDNAVLDAEAARIGAVVDVRVSAASLQHAIGGTGSKP